MQTAVADNPQLAARRRRRSNHDFVSLASPVFELLLQLQAEVIAPGHEIRPTIKRLLEDFEQRAKTLRYSDSQIQAVKFALAAFADEVVLTAAFPLRDEWEKFPLQLEYFGEHLAGVKFFERLEGLTKNMTNEADVVELYYVCMLLGFKGKYKAYMEDQLNTLIEATASQLRKAGRLQDEDLSPHWKMNDQPPPSVRRGVPIWIWVASALLFTFVFVVYIALNLLLSSDLHAAQEQLLR
ncbi:MAG: type IVB secretion system protein IcmH/DotU [Pyrinomonadaceae bacterium]